MLFLIECLAGASCVLSAIILLAPKRDPNYDYFDRIAERDEHEAAMRKANESNSNG